MILLAHMLMGAAIGHLIKNPFLAIILAFLSHYFLDLFPHVEYSIKNIKNKEWRSAGHDFLKVILDFLAALALISFFANNWIIYICVFFSILPDGFSLLANLIPHKTLSKHKEWHGEKIHFLKYKKIPMFWKILTQVLTAIICLLLLRL